MNVLDMLLEALSPQIILLLTAGVVVGIIGGALPGISSTTTAALMATFAFTMDTTRAVMFMAATQVGSTYGGSNMCIRDRATRPIRTRSPGEPPSDR